MHDEIIRYYIDGEITDANLESHKTQLVEFVEGQMRDDGVVPSLDLEPSFTMEYLPEKEVFAFGLSVYGIFVGGEGDLWGTAGVMNGKRIPKHK